MTQSTITRFFKKELPALKQSTDTHYIKEEIDIDWDERDNCYGESLDNGQRECTSKMVLDKLPESVWHDVDTKYPSSAMPKPESSNKFGCPRCKKNYKSKQSLDAHRRYCERDLDLQCAHCSYKTRYKSTLICHLSSSHGNGKDQNKRDDARKYYRICEKCHKTSKAVCPSKCESCSNKLLYQCKICVKLFKTLSLVGYHWDTRCGVTGYFNCPKCDFKSVWRTKVAQHMKLMHRNLDINQELENIEWIGLIQDNMKAESESYKCPKCAKTMMNSIKLSQHIRVCGGQKGAKKFDNLSKNDRDVCIVDPKLSLSKCSSCGKQFGHIYSLNNHTRYCKKKMEYMTKVTNDEDIEDAESDYPSESFISADKRYARYIKMMVRYCSKCQEDSAIEEKNRGIGSKMSCRNCESTLLFKCKKCLKECTTYKAIKHHLDTNCNPKGEYKCTKCSYISHIPNLVKTHYHTMHGTDNVECNQCGSKFRRIDQLRIHLLRCGVEPIFQCEHCLFKSKRKLDLKRHIFHNHMGPVIINRNDVMKRSRLSDSMIHLTAYCSKCKSEKRLSNRLKTCAKCKTKLCFQCKTCKKNHNVDDKNSCIHVKAYLKTIRFECKYCGQGLKLERILRGHERLCAAKFNFKCRFCEYTDKRKANIAAHEKVMHFNEAFII